MSLTHVLLYFSDSFYDRRLRQYVPRVYKMTVKLLTLSCII